MVTAAQAEALELSGKNKFIPYEFTTPNFLTKICSEAGVTGSVTYGINFSESPDTEISYLEYKTKGDIIVAYDINTNVLYYIKEVLTSVTRITVYIITENHSIRILELIIKNGMMREINILTLMKHC